ncbi:MAG: hypothetical protein SPD47_04345 [Oscillospiraceae bacterium]|nr:hypothetical protein [Oscillospiraceae bacterium]
MTVNELGTTLQKMCDTSGVNKTTMIHLFGILYKNQIEESGASLPEILKVIGFDESYKTEIRKGINLAKYVQLKPEYEGKF